MNFLEPALLVANFKLDMLKKTTALVGGALVLSTVVFTSAGADTISKPLHPNQKGIHMPHKKGEKNRSAEGSVSHGIVTALTGDGFAMEARTKTGSTTVIVRTNTETIFKKDKKAATASGVVLGARVFVRGEKDAAGTTQVAKSVMVITKSFATHPFPEMVKHKKQGKK